MATEAAVETTVQGLDPVARGVLDLALRHDFSDASIAQVVRRSDHEVTRLREQTMALVAAELGYAGDDDVYERTRVELLTVPAELWIGVSRRPPEPEPAVEPEPEPDPEIEVESEPEPDPEIEVESEPEVEREPEPDVEELRGGDEKVAPGRVEGEAQRSSRLLLAALMLVGALVVVLFLSRSGDDQPSGEPTAAETSPAPAATPADEPEPAPTPEPEPSPAPQSPPEDAIVLEALPGASAGGTVTVGVTERDGARFARVDLDGLRKPGGVYTLWLFTSLITSQPLGSTISGDGSITARLPGDAESYTFLDLSLEQSGGDRLHSGRSVMRISTAAVLQPGD